MSSPESIAEPPSSSSSHPTPGLHILAVPIELLLIIFHHFDSRNPEDCRALWSSMGVKELAPFAACILYKEVYFNRFPMARLEAFPLHRGPFIQVANLRIEHWPNHHLPSALQQPRDCPQRRSEALLAIAEKLTSLTTLYVDSWSLSSTGALVDTLPLSIAATLTSLDVRGCQEAPLASADKLGALIARAPLLNTLQIWDIAGVSAILDHAIPSLVHLQTLSLRSVDIGAHFGARAWTCPLRQLLIERSPNIHFTTAWKIARDTSRTLRTFYHYNLDDSAPPFAEQQPVYFPLLERFTPHRGLNIAHFPPMDAPMLTSLMLRLDPLTTFGAELAHVERVLQRHSTSLKHMLLYIPDALMEGTTEDERDRMWGELSERWPRVELRWSVE